MLMDYALDLLPLPLSAFASRCLLPKLLMGAVSSSVGIHFDFCVGLCRRKFDGVLYGSRPLATSSMHRFKKQFV